MAVIRALKGFRYNQNKISNISDVIAPPYDVINSDQQKKLLNSSQYNVVHIDLTMALAMKNIIYLKTN